MDNRIGIVGIYFGKLPNYFSLWVKSCSANHSIDFHVITDDILKIGGVLRECNISSIFFR